MSGFEGRWQITSWSTASPASQCRLRVTLSQERQLEESRAEAEAEAAERSAVEAREREDRLAQELNQAHTSMEALKRLYNATQSQLFNVQSRRYAAYSGSSGRLGWVYCAVQSWS